MTSPDLFITGTDTGVGKTLLSALLLAALDRNYWKPIQTGACEGTDRESVMKWADVPPDRTFPETYIFDPPVSPHLAAEWTQTSIDLNRIQRPASTRALIIEGAGGVMVPINERDLMLDVLRHLSVPVVVAARSALGTINHTLLTLSTLRAAGIETKGVVMIGKQNDDNRRAIEHHGRAPVIGFIPWLDTIDCATLRSVFNERFDRQVFA